MSEQNKIQNEEELWDLLSTEPTVDSKAEKKSKHAGKFEKDKAEPEAAPAEAAPKAERKLDGFFYGCMTGVAALSVAATLLITGMAGTPGGTPAVNGTAPVTGTESTQLQALELENAELRAKLDLQKQQIMDLQAQLIEAVGSEDFLATAPTNPDGTADEDIINEQMEAYEILNQIRDAYINFDREAIEALIPEMDARLSYLSNDALYEYYTILEYVEQPSNG